MLHVVTLFSIDANPDAENAFVRSLRVGGDWHTLARRVAPELVAADLLRHRLWPLFLCHDFWTSAEAYRRACQSPAVQLLLLVRRQMAEACFDLGPFSFPALGESQTCSEAMRPHRSSSKEHRQP